MTSQFVERPWRSRRHEQEHLRRRLAYERARRGWTAEELSRHLAQVGISLSPAILYNLEGSTPTRRPRVVKVDELAAFALVYGVSVGNLLKPPERALSAEVEALIQDMGQHREHLLASARHLSDAVRRAFLLLPEARDMAVVLDRMAAVENHLLDVVDVAIDLEVQLESGTVEVATARPTRTRRRDGKHQQAP